jgi:hypothetical protein
MLVVRAATARFLAELAVAARLGGVGWGVMDGADHGRGPYAQGAVRARR